MLNLSLDSDQFKSMIQEELKKHIPNHEPVPYMMDVLTACGYLSISRPTLATLLKQCDIPTYSVGKKKLFKRSDIEHLADELTERSKAKNYDLLEEN